MIRHRFVLAGTVALLIVVAAASVAAQLLTSNAPARLDGTVLIRASILNQGEQAFSIPDDRDFILTDVVASCRTLNHCLLFIFGPTLDQSGELALFEVPANSTVSHAFNTGIRVPGGNGGQLFLKNIIQPGPNALLWVTVTGYLVRK